MEVLLRKASTLARACGAAASKIDVNGTLTLSVYSLNRDDLLKMLEKASSEAAQRVRDVLELQQTQSEIRRLIGRANTDKVSELLTERDCLNSQEKTLIEVLGIKSTCSR